MRLTCGSTRQINSSRWPLSTSPRLLFVEDNDHKRDRVRAFLAETYPHWEVVDAQSFNSGYRAAREGDFNLVVLDISLPTFDKTAMDSGWRFRSLAGRELARKILRKKPAVRIVFLTQYESFSDGNSSLTL